MEGRSVGSGSDVRAKLTVVALGSQDAYDEWLPSARNMEPDGVFVRATHPEDVRSLTPRFVEVVLLDGWLDEDEKTVKATMRMVRRRFGLLAKAIARDVGRPEPVVRSMLDEEFRTWRNTAAALQAVLMRKGEV